MKIIYVSAAAIPSRTANSIHVMKMCQGLSQEGYDVMLLAPQGRGEQDLESVDLWHHYGIESRFPLQRVPAPGERFGNYLYATLCIRYCLRANLVYSRHLPTAALVARLGLPVIFETHEVPFGRVAPSLFQTLLASSNLKRVVVISHALKQLLLEAYPRKANSVKTLVAPDGIDLERFQNLPDPTEARNRLRLRNHNHAIAGYAGHLYAGRGIDLIIELARRCSDIMFLFLGGNPEDVTTWRERVDRAGISNAVFAGFVPNKELPLFLAACNILLMPYQRRVAVSGGGDTSQWMSPMKMFEYMATGRLIITSDLPVLREVLNESNACLVPPEDVDGWQAALQRAVRNITWRHELGEQARRDAQQYSWRQRVVKCLDSVIHPAQIA